MVRIEDLFKFKEHPQCKAYRSITFRWNIIWNIPEFSVLEKCEQNPKWHFEGNVKKHVELVCKHAIKEVLLMSKKEDVEHDIYNIAMRTDEFETCYLEPSLFNVALTLLTAALFHDIGKGVTTFKGQMVIGTLIIMKMKVKRLPDFFCGTKELSLEKMCVLL